MKSACCNCKSFQVNPLILGLKIIKLKQTGTCLNPLSGYLYTIGRAKCKEFEQQEKEKQP